MDNPQKDRREQEIGSSSRTLGLASAPSKADSWEKSQLDKIKLRSNFILNQSFNIKVYRILLETRNQTLLEGMRK